MLANNIRYLRKQRGWSQEYIAEKLGYKSFTTIQKWEQGLSEPPLKKAKQLADLFNVDMDDLANVNMMLPSTSSEPRAIKIKVLGRVAAGVPIEAITDILDEEEITEDMARTGEFFGLKIQGDSMEPRILSGDVVIVKQQSDVESGEIAIVTVNGTDATCKKIKKLDEGIMLIANNPKYEPKFYTNEDIKKLPITVLGKVVELRGKM